MRRRILAEVDDAIRARESLAQRGMIVLTLRDELAPPPVAPPEGLEVALRFRPSETLVAGDWYEFRREGSRLTFVVADVSGHGPTAGVFALKTKLLVQVALRQGLGPAAAMAWSSTRAASQPVTVYRFGATLCLSWKAVANALFAALSRFGA